MPLGTGTARLFASSAQLDLLRRPSHTSITIRRRERVSERSHCEAADEGAFTFLTSHSGTGGDSVLVARRDQFHLDRQRFP